MPAITVDDVLVLPRLPRLDPATTAFRPVRRRQAADRSDRGGCRVELRQARQDEDVVDGDRGHLKPS